MRRISVEVIHNFITSYPFLHVFFNFAHAETHGYDATVYINYINNLSISRKLPIVVNMNDIPQDSLPPKLTELPPPLPSKMKPNSSDSNLISHHQSTLPARTKQNSDNTLVNNQHGVHNHTLYTRDTSPLQLVQEITLAAPTLDSNLMPPPLPSKPTAV